VDNAIYQSQPTAMHVGYGVCCVSQVGMTELIFVNPGVKANTAMSCCLSRCFQQSNVSQNVVYTQNNMLLAAT